jgi:hypothetical protein
VSISSRGVAARRVSGRKVRELGVMANRPLIRTIRPLIRTIRTARRADHPARSDLRRLLDRSRATDRRADALRPPRLPGPPLTKQRSSSPEGKWVGRSSAATAIGGGALIAWARWSPAAAGALCVLSAAWDSATTCASITVFGGQC